jgi:hypothetical protein
MNPNLDLDKVLHQVRLMSIEVKSGVYFRDELTTKYNYLYTNSIHLFDMVLQNKSNYFPMLLKMIERAKLMKQTEDNQQKQKIQSEMRAEVNNKYIIPYLDTDTLNKEGIDINEYLQDPEKMEDFIEKKIKEENSNVA